MRFAVVVLVLGVMLSGLGGCSIGSKVSVRSLSHHTRLTASLPVLAFVASDETTADIFLTDIPRRDLERNVPLGELTGHILHIHMFLRPVAGRTPISDEASTASTRLVILTGGEIGVYGGGGFLTTSTKPTGRTLKGSMKDASLEYRRGTAGFHDQLGGSLMDVSFRAVRDPSLAGRLATRMRQILIATPEATKDEPSATAQ